MERPPTHNREMASETAERYLRNLGLSWSELKGKKVLDVGAGTGEFEHVARKQGVDVVSMDMGVGQDPDYMPPKDTVFVVARATKMPFPDETFDFAVAHMSVTNYREDGYSDHESLRYLEDTFRETARILKPDGQFRFMQGSIDEEDVALFHQTSREEAMKGRGKRLSVEQEHQVFEELVKRAGFRELKLDVYPDSHPEKDDYRLSHHYSAYK